MSALRARWFLTVAMMLSMCVAVAQAAEPVSRRQLRDWTRLLRSDDAQKRSAAAAALLGSDDEAALKVLLDALQPDQPDPMRISIITAFGVQGDDRATARLIATLDDANEAVRQAASAALTTINTPAAVLQMAQAATDPKRTQQARVQIMNILGELRSMEAVPALVEALSDKEDAIRTAARATLERIALRSFSTPQEWAAWARHISSLKREEILEELVQRQSERLRSLNALVEELYLQLLKDRKDPNDPAPLLAALAKAESPKVRLFVIKELRENRELRGKAVTDALSRLLTDADPPVRLAATEALGAMGDAAAASPALVKALEDTVVAVRVAAATALGSLKARDAVRPLCDRLADPAPEAASAAAAALGDIADPLAIDALTATVKGANTTSPVYDAAAASLARIKDQRVIPTLTELLESPKDSVRWSAVDALGGYRAADLKGAIPLLLAVAQKDANPQVREAALASLGKISDPAGLETLADAMSDPQKRIADQALRSLLQLVDADPALCAAAVERLLAGRRFALADVFSASAIERLSRTPATAPDGVALRARLAAGLVKAKEWALARPHLEALVEKSPKDATYARDLVLCLSNLADADALLTRLAQFRRAMPEQGELWWAETVKAVELFGAGDAAKVIAAVDALEKENADLGGASTAARLRDLRARAKEKLTQPPPPAPEPKVP